MKRFNVFAPFHPYWYVIVLIFITVILIIIAYTWGELFKGSELNQYIGQSITQLVSTLFFVFIIWRSGWLRSSGFTFIGRGQTWLIISLPLIYVLAVNIYIITGDFSLRISNFSLIFWLNSAHLTCSLFEETVFRGVVLFTFLWLWGHSKSGMTKSILMAALLFGGIHILWLGENPLLQTFLGMLTAVLIGFFYGVVLLHGRSIWIPIIFHGLLNVVITFSILGKDTTETIFTSFLMLVAYIPVFLLGIYLLKKIPQRWENFQSK